MPVVTNRFGILVPVIEQEPVTSKNIPRISRFSRVREQLISRTIYSDVNKNTMGLEDKNRFGIFDPFDALGNPLRPTGDVTVIVDPVAGVGAPILILGPYRLEPGKDYVSGGGVAVTAANIAAAINNLEEYTASALGAVVSVEGPVGEINISFYAYYQLSPPTFTFTYVNEEFVLGYTTSPIQPPEIS